MTEEELRELKKKIVNIILAHDLYEQQIILGQKPMTKQVTLGDVVNQILTLIKEAGWDDCNDCVYKYSARHAR